MKTLDEFLDEIEKEIRSHEEEYECSSSSVEYVLSQAAKIIREMKKYIITYSRAGYLSKLDIGKNISKILNEGGGE